MKMCPCFRVVKAIGVVDSLYELAVFQRQDLPESRQSPFLERHIVGFGRNVMLNVGVKNAKIALIASPRCSPHIEAQC